MATHISLMPAPAPACNCRICPFYMDNPDAVEPICSGKNSGCSYCGCAAAEYGHRTGACNSCPVRCGSRVDIYDWMADVGGTLSFDDIPATSTIPKSIPRFIPVVDGVASELDGRISWPAYGIGLRRVYSPLTWDYKPLWKEGTAHDALRIPKERAIILVGYGTDPLVEAFWTRRKELYPLLAEKKFDLVLSPNYSMYGNHPRTEHLLNFRRNLLIASEMLDEGIPAVPNIYWFRKEDLDRYILWMEDVEPEAIAINLQTFRTDEDWEVMALPGLTYLAISMPQNIRVIINGTSRKERLAQLVELFGEQLTLVSQSPVQEARHGKVMKRDGGIDKIMALPEDAFAQSVSNVDGLIGDLLKESASSSQSPSFQQEVELD